MNDHDKIKKVLCGKYNDCMRSARIDPDGAPWAIRINLLMDLWAELMHEDKEGLCAAAEQLKQAECKLQRDNRPAVIKDLKKQGYKEEVYFAGEYTRLAHPNPELADVCVHDDGKVRVKQAGGYYE